jgi:hypothetical protein
MKFQKFSTRTESFHCTRVKDQDHATTMAQEKAEYEKTHPKELLPLQDFRQQALGDLIKDPSSNSKRFDEVREVMRHLSLCHTIMINPDSKELIWQSPDEFELVV